MEALRKDARVQTEDKGEVREEFTCKVSSRREREKAVQVWASDMQRIIQTEERRHEARERTRMEQDYSNSQGRR